MRSSGLPRSRAASVTASVLAIMTLASANAAADEPASAAAPSDTPATSTTPAPAPTEAKNEASKESKPGPRGYVGAGGMYLPVNDGLLVLTVNGGASAKHTDDLDVGVGGRLAFGESKYSTAFALIPEVHIARWWGIYGIGAYVGPGLIIASKKAGGWDGVLLGLLAGASPVRLRFGMVEAALDLGVLYAVAQPYPSPYIMPTVTARF